MMQADREAQLLNDYQRDFPLAPAPYAEIAARLDVDEPWVRQTLASWQADGRVSRVGAVFRPRAIGVSTLAALAVPDEAIERVAEVVSAVPGVNHNYEREHRFNLWFVLHAADERALDAALDAIRRKTGHAPLSLPLVADYWIDLGFDLAAPESNARCGVPRIVGTRSDPFPVPLSDVDRRVIAALEHGLPLIHAPYAAVANRAGVSEKEVLDRVARWLRIGVIARLGIILRHRELGYAANAMCVWDVPDERVDRIGMALARETGVTLCYRRARDRAHWPYNLYCMIHGTHRAQVELAAADIAAWHGLDAYPAATLFSRRRFKQCGARRFADALPAGAAS